MIEMFSFIHILVGCVLFASISTLYIFSYLRYDSCEKDPQVHALVFFIIVAFSLFWQYMLLVAAGILFFYFLGYLLFKVKQVIE